MKTNILLLTIIMLSISCKNEIDIASISNSSTDDFYQTTDDIEQAVVACYDALQQDGQYGFNYMILMEIRSDNAHVENITNAGGAYGNIDNFQMTSSNVVVDQSWKDCYIGIQRCNSVLNRIGAIEMDATIKGYRIGEAKFLRALTYFNIVRIWGAAPLVLEETEDPFESFSTERSPVATVYAQIVEDLTSAISELPATTDEAGRATKGAAQALLGKVHLTLGNYDEAITSLRAVTGYTLISDFSNIFGPANENNAESIFEVQFTAGAGEGSRLPTQVAPTTSAAALLGFAGIDRGENIPSSDLFSSFEVGDTRRDASIGIFMQDAGPINYAKKLITTIVDDNDSDLNVIILRYADVLLMLAEALNEQSYVANGEAFDLLNQVRIRSGLPALSEVELSDQSSFRDAVLEERRHEFVSENHRWFDLLRTGTALAVMNASTSAFTVNEYQLLYPIPLSQIDAVNNSTIFSQNLGY